MQELEKELVQLISDSFMKSIKKLNTLLNQDIEGLFDNVNMIEDIDSIPEILESVVILPQSSPLGGSYIILPSSCAAPLSDLMMTGEIQESEANVEISDLKASALKESFSQLMDVYSGEMSKALSQSVTFNVDNAIYSKDSATTKKLMSTVLKGAVILNYKVTFSKVTKDVIRQVIPIEFFNEMLELIKPDISSNEELLAMHDINPKEINMNTEDSIMVQPVQFPSFDEQTSMQLEGNKNFNLLLDIKLKLTVELGRSELPIKRVLELTRGSIIELDKIAGEPVELFANGKLIARGEVVVIEDNFGLRITNIISPDDRIKNL